MSCNISSETDLAVGHLPGAAVVAAGRLLHKVYALNRVIKPAEKPTEIAILTTLVSKVAAPTAAMRTAGAFLQERAVPDSDLT